MENFNELKILSSRLLPQVCLLDKIGTDETTLQLLSIFLTLDASGKGYLTRGELISALQFVGLAPREPTLAKYNMENNFVNTKKNTIKNIKVDMKTFIAITLEQLRCNNGSNDFSLLFDLMSKGEKSITLKDLRHLLVYTMSPSKMNKHEFDTFLQTLGISDANREKLEGSVDCEILLDKLKLL